MSDKHLEWRSWCIDVEVSSEVRDVIGLVYDKWSDPDGAFRVTDMQHLAQFRYRIWCDYIAKGADANDARKKITQVLEPVGVKHMTVTTLDVIRVGELLARWRPAPHSVLAIR